MKIAQSDVPIAEAPLLAGRLALATKSRQNAPMKSLLGFIGLAMSMSVTTVPALACSYTSAPEPVGFPSGSFIAGGLYDAASFVDLVVAERARPIAGSTGQGFGQVITFRVIQRWKGRSPDRFTLYGEGLHPDGVNAGKGGWLRHHWVDEAGRVYPHATPWEALTSPLASFTSCDPRFIRPAAGRTYVVFREADGRLLGPVVHHPGMRAAQGLEFVEVGGVREDDWFGATFLRSASDTRTPASPPVGGPASGRALLVFARPMTGDAAAGLLRRAGVRPVAVHALMGDFVDELRVPEDRATPTLVADALRAARDNLAGDGAREAARLFLPGLTAEELENDGWKRTYAAALVLADERLARAPTAGPPLVGSVEVLGSPAALSALRRDPRVAGVLDGFTLRDHAAVPPPRGREAVATLPGLDAQARTLSPLFLLQRLRVIAGGLAPDAPAPPRSGAPTPAAP